MLSLVPVFLLIIAAIFMQVFGIIKMRAGTTWLIAAVLTFAAWLTMLPIGLLLPPEVAIRNWLPTLIQTHTLIFSYTPLTWVFGFLILTLLVAVVFSEAKHLESPGYVQKLSGSIILTAFGLLAILSRSVLSFILAWALIDLVEFGLIAILIGRPKSHSSATTAVLFRAVGILLLIVFTAIVPSEISTGLPDSISKQQWWLLIVLTLFRTGTLPLYQPYIDTPAYQRGIVTLLRIMPLVTVFAFITFISPFSLPEMPGGALIFLLDLALLYGAVSWFSKENEIKGRPYWLFSMAGFGLLSFLTSRVAALSGIALVLVIGGSGLFLYIPRLSKKINAFIVVLLLSLLMLPFSPSAPFAQLFTAGISVFHKIIWFLSYAFLIAGVVKHALRRVDHSELLEPWMTLFHSIALYFVAVAPWLMVAVFFRAQAESITWWPWIITLLITSVFLFLFFFFSHRISYYQGRFKPKLERLRDLEHLMSPLFKFTWLSRFLDWLGFGIEKTVNLLTKVLEGDGGVLWSFLFIVLLLSLLLTRQVP